VWFELVSCGNKGGTLCSGDDPKPHFTIKDTNPNYATSTTMLMSALLSQKRVTVYTEGCHNRDSLAKGVIVER
jgi:hypothetical protein